jgi:hypothetical protein
VHFPLYSVEPMQEMLRRAKERQQLRNKRTCSKRVQEQSLGDSLSAAALPAWSTLSVTEQRAQTLLENDKVEGKEALRQEMDWVTMKPNSGSNCDSVVPISRDDFLFSVTDGGTN